MEWRLELGLEPFLLFSHRVDSAAALEHVLRLSGLIWAPNIVVLLWCSTNMQQSQNQIHSFKKVMTTWNFFWCTLILFSHGWSFKRSLRLFIWGFITVKNRGIIRDWSLSYFDIVLCRRFCHFLLKMFLIVVNSMIFELLLHLTLCDCVEFLDILDQRQNNNFYLQ